MTTALTTDAATQDPARAVQFALLWGVDGVALRTVGGARVPEITEGPLRRRLEDAELPVLALDPGLFEGGPSDRAVWLNDLARLDDVARFAARVGCGLLRIGALGVGDADPAAAADALRRAGDRAAAHGLRLAVRNEAGTTVATGAALAPLLARIAHDAVGADWRPADALRSGEDPAAGLAALIERGVVVHAVGVRDGRGRGASWEDAPVGAGAVGWEDHLEALVAIGVDGPLVIDALPEPARSTGLASATALIRGARAAVRAARG